MPAAGVTLVTTPYVTGLEPIYAMAQRLVRLSFNQKVKVSASERKKASKLTGCRAFASARMERKLGNLELYER